MKKLFKRGLIILFAGLCFCNIVSFVNFNKGHADAVAENSSSTTLQTEASAQKEKNFYETSESSATFTVEQVNSDAVACVYDSAGFVKDDSVQYRIDKNKIYVSNIDSESLVLGNDYILTLTYEDEEVQIPFMYVTKALRTVEDLSVFDIDVKGKIIDGYYALANDIDAGYEKRILDHNGYSKTGGFAGTFDGLGHSLTFMVGNGASSANRVGFFGFLQGGAVIKNTAFVDIMTNSCAILAKASNALYDSQVYISNCYFSIHSGFLCLGAILENGQVWVNLENILIDWPGVLYDVETSGQTYSGAIFAKYINRGHASTDNMMKNVYVISKAPLAFNRDKGYEGAMNSKNYYVFYAKNDGMTADMPKGVYIFNNVKRYVSGAEMVADTSNSYVDFPAQYWDFSSGIPIFKSALTSACGISINGENINRKVLYTNSAGGLYTTSVTIAPSLLGAPIQNIDAVYEILEGADCIAIDEDNGLVTAIKEGKAKLKLSYTFNEEFYEKTVTLTIKSPLIENSSQESGCNSSFISGISFSFFLGSAAIVLFVKRKRV